jgi:hypothetical protein
MEVRLDALVAEIAETVESNVLRDNAKFAILQRPNRMHLILLSLMCCDIVRSNKTNGGMRWRPSRRLNKHVGVKDHGIPDERERTEKPMTNSTLADEFSETLRANSEVVVEVAFHVLRCFAMYQMGLLEYRREDGRCRFYRSSPRLLVEDEDGNKTDFVDRYLLDPQHFY